MKVNTGFARKKNEIIYYKNKDILGTYFYAPQVLYIYENIVL